MIHTEPPVGRPFDFRALTPRGRLELIDALRGLSILLMVAYHVGVDLYLMKLLPKSVLYGPLLTVLQPLFAGVFILLSGVSARFARDNVRRGAQALCCGMLVTFASSLFAITIPFGILHGLGSMMILHGLWPAHWRRPRFVPGWLVSLGWALAFAAAFLLFPRPAGVFEQVPYIYALGLIPKSWNAMADYFPLLPWFFLYGLGGQLGKYVAAGRAPRWLYRFTMPVLPLIGRHTLLIYLLHQPLVLGVLWLLFGRLF